MSTTAQHGNAVALVRDVAALPGMHRLKNLGVVQRWRDRHHYEQFLSRFASFYGVFDDFEDARRALPPSREFDQRALTEEYETVRCHRIFNYDYPVLYWLQKAFRQGARSVLDLGGSVGVHYFGYRRLLDYPAQLRWTVSEVPEVCEVGRGIAAREQVAALEFSDTLDPVRIDADIWLSCGALQYIEHGQPERLLATCARRPGHIIFNKLPLYAGEDFVTAQNVGERSYAPTYVYNDARFIAAVERVGYRLVDRWDVQERSFYLPGHPERSFKSFSGLYFSATDTDASRRLDP